MRFLTILILLSATCAAKEGPYFNGPQAACAGSRYAKAGLPDSRVSNPRLPATTKVYDQGKYAGKQVQRGDETRFYDKGGTYQGREKTTGTTTKFYDKGGTLRGYSTKK